jgi:hypothetical protein
MIKKGRSGIAIGLGAGISTAIGVAMNNVAFGIGTGIFILLLSGPALSAKKKHGL